MLPPSLVYFQLANEKARAAALETDMQQRVREAVTAGERRDRELRIKEAMLEDQNDSIKKLKASLASLQELQSVTERGLNDTIQELMVRRRVYAARCVIATVGQSHTTRCMCDGWPVECALWLGDVSVLSRRAAVWGCRAGGEGKPARRTGQQ